MPGRAPRTRFTSQMDAIIRARLQTASGRARRGEVKRAVADAAAELGLPPGAVLKRWYRLRSLDAPSASRRRPVRPAGPAPDPGANSVPGPAAAHAPQRPAGIAALLAAYQRALARTAACRAELAHAETELSEAASRLALHLLERPGP